MLLPVEVDRAMVPVVRWLNGLPGARTLFSCQGQGEEGPEALRPYALFVCEDHDSLLEVVGALEDWGRPKGKVPATVELDYHRRTQLRYHLSWDGPWALRDFTHWLLKKGAVP